MKNAINWFEIFVENMPRAVAFYEEWFEDGGRVVGILERLLEIQPDDTWAFDRLKLIFDAQERSSALAEQPLGGLAQAGHAAGHGQPPDFRPRNPSGDAASDPVIAPHGTDRSRAAFCGGCAPRRVVRRACSR